VDTVANLADLLGRAARQRPDRVALVEAQGGRSLTWAELDAEADRVAQGLSGLGLVAGYRVLLALPNRIEFVTSYFGALRAGMVAVPVNPRSATGELVRMVADSGARLVVADPSTVTGVRAAVAGLEDALVGADEELRSRTVVPHVVVVDGPALPGETGYRDLAAPAAPPAAPPADPEALAVLLYTSGTSGRPRAAMLTHRALVSNVEQAAAMEPALVGAADTVLGVLPLFHVYGLNAVLGGAVRQQARLVLVDGFDPEEALGVVEEHAVTVLPVAPPVFGHWRTRQDLSERLRSVRVVVSGSAPLAPELAEELADRAGVEVHEGYGLTEAAPVVTSTRVSGARKRGSVGPPLPGVRLRLVDADGQASEPTDPGQIEIAGDNLFSGYWPDGVDGPGPDGWWATGDVGYLDADGDLFLVDRLKDLVIVSGFNVYPAEVEEVILELDAVAEAAVVGVPDDATGEAVVAYVRRADGSSLAPAEVQDTVREHCATRVARFKRPGVVHVVDELPHTATGKVAKGRLRSTERRRALGLLE
jgi:long-chain acyl-CoA synthetase